MSNIAIKGATTGTGTFTIESPATNTDRTLTLPDEAGTVLTSASTVDASNVLPSGLSVWPAFRLGLTGSQQVDTTDAVDVGWNITNDATKERFLDGFTHNAGVITVPVNGIYTFSAMIRMNSVGSGYFLVKILINNANDDTRVYSIDGNPDLNYDAQAIVTTLKLDANDNLRVTTQSSADSNYQVSSTSEFAGHLVYPL